MFVNPVNSPFKGESPSSRDLRDRESRIGPCTQGRNNDRRVFFGCAPRVGKCDPYVLRFDSFQISASDRDDKVATHLIVIENQRPVRGQVITIGNGNRWLVTASARHGKIVHSRKVDCYAAVGRPATRHSNQSPGGIMRVRSAKSRSERPRQRLKAGGGIVAGTEIK